MLTISRPAPNRIDIALDGAVEAEELRRSLDDLIAQAEDISEGRLFYKITNFSMPGMDVLAVKFDRLPKLFGLLGKFDRCAVVCDTAWIRTAAIVEGALLPGVEIRSFELSEVAEAEDWLTSDKD